MIGRGIEKLRVRTRGERLLFKTQHLVVTHLDSPSFPVGQDFFADKPERIAFIYKLCDETEAFFNLPAVVEPFVAFPLDDGKKSKVRVVVYRGISHLVLFGYLLRGKVSVVFSRHACASFNYRT